jgi:hypothetical protein|tara:strand:+ start:618 stop:815 length:198 start_codon:yes stop_codon:yes gene_type:complete
MESERNAKAVVKKFKKTQETLAPALALAYPPTPTLILTLQGMFSADKLKEEIVAPYKNQVIFSVV